MKRILYIEDQPFIDSSNLQFIETAKYFRERYNIDISFLFFWTRSCPNENILPILQYENLEYSVINYECNCKANEVEIQRIINDKTEQYEANIVQTGFIYRYMNTLISDDFKTYAYYSMPGQDIYMKQFGNMEIISKMTNMIVSYDLLDEYDNKPEVQCDNTIILPNTIPAVYFKNHKYGSIALDKHMESYYKLYFGGK